MLMLVDEIVDIRAGIPNSSWVCHERLAALQLKIWDRRIAHLMTLQGLAPEKNSLAGVSQKELKIKMEKYQEELSSMLKNMGQ